MSQKFYIILAMFFISSSIYGFVENQDIPNKETLLSRCRQSLSWTDSMSLHVDMDARSTENDAERLHVARDYTFRRDGERSEWIGKIIGYDREGNIGENTYYRKQIATGSRFLDVSNLPGKKPKRALISLDYKEHQENLLDDADTFGPLLGRISGVHHKSVIDLLSDGDNLSIADAMEEINGILCYKLKAESRYGEVAIWIAPGKGYNAIKWSIHQKPEHYINDKLVANINIGSVKMKGRLKVLEIKELKDIGDIFVPTRVNYTLTIKYTDDTVLVNTYRYKVDDIELNPDFEALGAFKVDLLDGTPVHVKEFPSIHYVWQNGKIVPADAPTFEEIDKIVEELKKEQQ